MVTEENKGLEVFGTKEVSVKEFMGSTDKSLMLLSDYEKAKQNLVELKEKHQARVAELVAIEKLSPSEFKELNDIREELREPRYLLQKIETNNISVFESYKKNDKAKRKELVDINHSLEETASTKLKAEEDRKKLEKEAEARAEENRINKIKKDIENIETYCSEIIQKMTFDNMKVSAESIEKSLNSEYDFEEYDLLFDQVKARVTKSLLDRTNDITDRENQRLENEKMKQEIFDGRVNRLKEVGYELLDGFFTDKTFDVEERYSEEGVLNLNSALFETLLSEIKFKKEQIKQNAILKEEQRLKKEQQDEQFEVRKKRFFEADFNITDNLQFFFSKEFKEVSIHTDKVFRASVTEFEEIFSEAKKHVVDAQKKREQDELDKQEQIKQEALAKKKADAENKARVKRLAEDKEWIKQNIQLSLLTIEDVSIKNEETKNFMSFANLQIGQLKADLLTQLNDL